jgi:hypothetical protein
MLKPAWQWARSGTGTFDDQVYAACPTPRVAIGGEFYSYTLNLGGISLTGPAGGPFSSYAFLAVYDTQGNLLWATSAGHPTLTVRPSPPTPEAIS